MGRAGSCPSTVVVCALPQQASRSQGCPSDIRVGRQEARPAGEVSPASVLAMGTGRPPWWQMTRTATPGFWFAGVYAAIAPAAWYMVAATDVGVWMTVLAVLWTVMAPAYLASSLAMRRSTRG